VGGLPEAWPCNMILSAFGGRFRSKALAMSWSPEWLLDIAPGEDGWSNCWATQGDGGKGRDAEGNDGAIGDEVQCCKSVERAKGIVGRILVGRVRRGVRSELRAVTFRLYAKRQVYGGTWSWN